MTATDKVVDRVQKLIALSSSPAEEEARTSALKACKLIREHGLVVGHPSDVKAVPTPSRPKPAPKPRPPKPRYAPPRTMILAHRGVCKACARYISRGEKVWWRPGVGIAHITCNYESLFS